MHCLIDPDSTHSYICTGKLVDELPTVEPLEYNIHVTNPLGHSVLVNEVQRKCPLMIQEIEFEADLIRLPFHEFDIILGMDWLSKYQAVIDCGLKTVVLKSADDTEIVVHGLWSSTLTNVISAMKAGRLMRKGCEAFHQT